MIIHADCKKCGEHFHYERKEGVHSGALRKYCDEHTRKQYAAPSKLPAFRRFDKKAITLKRIADTHRRECSYCGVVFIACLTRLKRGKMRILGRHAQTMCGKGCSTKAAADSARDRWRRIKAGNESLSEAEQARFDAVARESAIFHEIAAIRRIAKRKGISPRPPRNCDICWTTFKPTCLQQSCCSNDCRAEKLRRSNWQSTRKGRVVECPNCKAAFSPLRRPGYVGNWSACSDECQEEHRIRSIKKHKRAAKARRRAQEVGVKYETFDPFDVFRRDKWKCRSCGVSTPMHLRGTYDANAPELDHIVPLSRGGWHTPDNCQTLCRECNGDKGAMLPDEWNGRAAPTLPLF